MLAHGLGMTALGLLLSGCGDSQKGRVYFGNLEDGAQVESPFRVVMKTENLIVEPATLGVNEGRGHFHILVNTPLAPTQAPIPKDEKHIHYGQGETEAILDLPVGEHTLVLQFATGDHVPYDPQVFQQIRVKVTKQNPMPEKAAADSAAVADAPADSPEEAPASASSGQPAAPSAGK
jgi:hypothetical protein